ncbi:hypothetical protein C0993_011452 [Termitomyces sp. T159_Od127]|nr:hypothetical protein C0993_011452 [Termitomyces sp. T159_Od127]
MPPAPSSSNLGAEPAGIDCGVAPALAGGVQAVGTAAGLGPGALAAPGWRVMAQALLREGVGRMPFDLPAELDIDLAQLDILLAGHRQHNAIAPGMWLDVAVDRGERLLVRGDHLALLAAQMKMAMLVTGLAAGSREAESDEGAD